jgi:chromosome segregation ATPase
MGKQDELKKLDLAIKDTENRLKSFDHNISTLQKEIEFLLNLEMQLSENIAYLKKIKIITLATEFKKAKEDLKKTKVRLVQLKSDRTINEKSHKELIAFLEKSKGAYDKLAQTSENNVLQGKFGRKRD